MNIEQAKEHWKDVIAHDGGQCPVCNRWGKIYKRNINATMAASLMWLASEKQENGWVDVPKRAPKWLLASNQLSTLKWWNLVERCPSEEKSKTKFSGLWRPTEKGIAFALGFIKIPKSVYTYNDWVEDYGQDEIYIHDCFAEYFDYQEVMAGRYSSLENKGTK